MKKKKRFKFYSDPGHGWLAVKRQLLTDLNIADKISMFSYQKGKTVYLEEDSDAPIFIKAYGETMEIENIYHEKTAIRSYEPYNNMEK